MDEGGLITIIPGSHCLARALSKVLSMIEIRPQKVLVLAQKPATCSFLLAAASNFIPPKTAKNQKTGVKWLMKYGLSAI